jgi:hypothetical protein
LAVVVNTRFIFTAHADELGIEIVEFGSKVRGGACRHSGPDLAAINNNDGTAEPTEFVSCRQPSDTSADHDHVASLIALQRRRPNPRCILHPVGDTALVGDIHGALLIASPRNRSRSRIVPGALAQLGSFTAREVD